MHDLRKSVFHRRYNNITAETEGRRENNYYILCAFASPRYNLIAMTAPFILQIDNGNNYSATFGRCGNDAYLLPVVGSAFVSVFGIGPGIGIAFATVDMALLQYFFYFTFINMPAIHTAAGMFG